MPIPVRIRALVGVSLVAGALLSRPASAQEALPPTDGPALDSGTATTQPDKRLLDAIAKDLHLSLSAKPEETTLRLPLSPQQWSFFKGVQPYAAVSPSVVRPVTEGGAGLAAPGREPTEEPWKGLGLGAGVTWRLSDRVDLFGQYLFTTLPGAAAPTGSPFMRREIDNPGVKGGFSIHF